MYKVFEDLRTLYEAMIAIFTVAPSYLQNTSRTSSRSFPRQLNFSHNLPKVLEAALTKKIRKVEKYRNRKLVESDRK